MGWERRGQTLYYYRKKRVGKRVFSQYGGCGEIGQLNAALDAKQRIERCSRKAIEWRVRQEFEAQDRDLYSLNKAFRVVTCAQLLAEGYHRHNGQWRHRRE